MTSTISFGLRIPMRDGISLSARLYRPSHLNVKLPTILHFTPYISSKIHTRAQEFNKLGFAVLSVDCRGRAESGGTFCWEGPQIGRDGADIIEWVCREDWSSGEVFTRGGSANGFMQWPILGQSPRGLIASAPFAVATPGYDSDRISNIQRLDHIIWLAHVNGRVPNEEIYADDAFWAETFKTAHAEHWSLEKLANILGPNLGIWDTLKEGLDHPGYDAYWKARDISPEQYAKITQPILSLSGYYDGNLPGTLLHHAQHMRYGPADVTANHFLVLGPWDHADVMRGSQMVAGHMFAEASLIPREQLHVDFFNWARGLGPRPDFLKGRVGWYVMGAEEWRWVNRFEDIAVASCTAWLESDGNADEEGKGALSLAGPAGSPDVFCCDPFDTRLIDLKGLEPPDYVVSPDFIRLAGGDGVTYSTAPLSSPMEISGSPRLTLWLEADAPDFDLHVAVHEVFPDGSLFFMTEASWRARWRKSLEEQQLMPIGEMEECVIDNFFFVSRRLAEGSRLRIIIRHLNSTRMLRNYNSGGQIGYEQPDSGRVATIRVHHDPVRPSRLELPLSREQ